MSALSSIPAHSLRARNPSLLNQPLMLVPDNHNAYRDERDTRRPKACREWYRTSSLGCHMPSHDRAAKYRETRMSRSAADLHPLSTSGISATSLAGMWAAPSR